MFTPAHPFCQVTSHQVSTFYSLDLATNTIVASAAAGPPVTVTINKNNHNSMAIIKLRLHEDDPRYGIAGQLFINCADQIPYHDRYALFQAILEGQTEYHIFLSAEPLSPQEGQETKATEYIFEFPLDVCHVVQKLTGLFFAGLWEELSNKRTLDLGEGGRKYKFTLKFQ